jgi:hypothetical protein
MVLTPRDNFSASSESKFEWLASQTPGSATWDAVPLLASNPPWPGRGVLLCLPMLADFGSLGP